MNVFNGYGKGIQMIKITALCLLSMVAFLMVYHNSHHYDRPIGQITSVINGSEEQTLTLTLTNGSEPGRTVQLNHDYEPALVYGEKYHRGDFLFLEESVNDTDQITYSIVGQKRDYFIALLFILLFDALLLVGGRQGTFTILGLVLNVCLFYGMLSLYSKGIPVFPLTVVIILLFSVILLVLINGINKITALSILATLSAVTVVGILSAVAIHWAPPVAYEFMEYLPEPFSYEEANAMLLSEILIGGLGVMLDISVSLTACGMELLRKNPLIPSKELVSSCKQVAEDITGTMINVVLLTNIAGFIPVFMLSMENGFHLSTIMKNNLFFPMVRFLTGSMGIILVIPITIGLLSLMKNRRSQL